MAFKWYGELLRIFNTARTAYVDVAHDGTNATVDASSGDIIFKAATTEVLRIKSASLRMAATKTIIQDANGATYGELYLYNPSNGDVSLKTTFSGGDVRLTCGASGFVFLIGNVDASGATYIILPGGCRDWGARSAAPTSPTPVAGDRYYDTVTNKLRCYNGTIWNDLF